MRLPHVLLAIVVSLAASARAAEPSTRHASLVNSTGKTVIRKAAFGNDEATVIVSKAGTAVVCDPQNMAPGVRPDFVAITHDHHLDKAYAEQSKGVQTVMQQTGTWTVGDVRVTGIAGSHTVAPVDKAKPAIVTYLVEADGLRIAFFACNGQQQLEPEQVAALGKVDVALITLENGFGLSTAHARDLMKQLGARVVVPLSHHVGDMEYNMDMMAELVGGKYETVKELALAPGDLKGSGQRMVHILAPTAP